MSKPTRKPKYGAGQIFQGEIITLKTIDWFDTIKDPENWTRGPVLPVVVVDPPARKKRSSTSGRKKNTRRKKT